MNSKPKSFDQLLVQETHIYLCRSVKWTAYLSVFLLVAIFFATVLQKHHLLSVQDLLVLQMPALCIALFGLAGILYRQPERHRLGLVLAYLLVLEVAWIYFVVGHYWLTSSYSILGEYTSLAIVDSVVDVLVFTFAISLFPLRNWLLVSVIPLLSVSLVTRIIETPENPIFAVTKFTCLLVIIVTGQKVLQEWFRKAILRDAEKQQLLQQFKHMALIDGLTNLSNRRHFDEVLALEIKAAKRTKDPLSMILLDVDYFKRLNDSIGHQQGDKCLIRIAEVLHGIASRPRDLAARYGGEEFAVILPDTDLDGASHIAEQIRAALKAAEIAHPDSDLGAFVTVSQGVSLWQPGLSAQDLTASADQLLYLSKAQGRDCFSVGVAKAEE
ncbi:GGDEF domain-containing protein [Shewanella marisflavi]|uniref:diguanylate cyclase n=1 Tax=Shewanella marisflavi TaxID=260364 RepID=A0AAC9U2Y8_9GAMM|nr:membrane-associated sensor domain-containing protein [Shewanella marisflavi]ASJ97887.1 GGDEF domain-containing protein [Shewanella marisflavi]